MHDLENAPHGAAAVCPTCGKGVPGDAPEGLCPNCLLESGFRTPPSEGPMPSTSGYGIPFVAPEPQKLAQHFPQLEIKELLGQGGMGAVYKARQKKLDRLVALKILPVESSNTPAFTERFNREAKALARLNHPNIITVHDYGEAGGLFYFIMEFVDGRNLRQLMMQRQLQPRDSLDLIPQICDALQYAHEEGVVHRDIKPENIMIDKKGRVKIADFGLAKLLHAQPAHFTLTGSRQMMGTPHYMAPEQMERPLEVDHRADIFSLGVVFYEMLTSELPLGRFAPPSHKVRVDRRLDDVVLRALTKEPEHRYQRVSEMKSAVEAVTRGALPFPQPALAAPATPTKPDLEMLRIQVHGPVAGLFLTAIVALISWAVILTVIPVDVRRSHWDFDADRYMHHRVESTLFDLYPGLGLAVGIPIGILVVGAYFMRRFRAYDLAIMASILAMVPWSPAWIFGIGVGAWSLGVLRRKEVQAAFALTANPASGAAEWLTPPPAVRQPELLPVDPPKRGVIRSFIDSVRNYWFTSADAPMDQDYRP
jgi:serine/threonine protein kinase